MKKFDFFLVLLAAALIGMGYYFSKEFRSETDHNLSSEEPAGARSKKRNTSPRNIQSEKQKEDDKSSSAETKPPSASAAYIQEYIELKKCLQTEDCNYSKSDPRSYELEALSAVNQHVSKIHQVGPFKERDALLRDALRLRDGHIKETILSFLKANKLYNSEWRDLVLDEYISFHDSKLIPNAIDYFKQFSSVEDKKIIHNRIYREISNGSPMVANELASHIKYLLDKTSLSFYKTHLSGIEEGPIKDSLIRQLRDFELASSAG